jgi:hypothetical protein
MFAMARSQTRKRPTPGVADHPLTTQETLDHFLKGFAPKPPPGRPAGVRLAPDLDIAFVAGVLLRQTLPGAEAVRIVGRVTAVLRSPAAERPRWDADIGELRWLSRLVRSFRRDAANQRAVLAAFEVAGWPSRILDPLAKRFRKKTKERRWETVKGLNRGLPTGTICFFSDGSGGIRWEANV